ncbi:serine hydrolase domain-containing protein [Actinocrispum wychmicini]|nr:serine hydrolase domain-containing protein [Actinocrispum wychmicini]
MAVSFARRVWVPAVAAVALAAGTTAPANAGQPGLDRTGLDQPGLDRALAAVHEAGMPGIYAEVRDGWRTWRGASGVADTATGRPVRPNLEHRVGSITKTFVATGLLQQVAAGRIVLDAPIGRYLPALVPGERGQQITVRMLLNHTSLINEHTDALWSGPDDIDQTRLTTHAPEKLVEIGLRMTPAAGTLGSTHAYSNTNYIIIGLLLEKVTGQPVRDYLTRNVIRAAGIGHTTYFPGTDPYIRGPHSRAYESMYGHWNPPKDFTVDNMSWAGMAGELVSTMDDLNRFYRALLQGKLLPPAMLAEMKRTVPISLGVAYGLGLVEKTYPGCGTFWGHGGGVLGMGTTTFTSGDGTRQVSVGVNLLRYEQLGPDGQPVPNPITAAYNNLLQTALCPGSPAASTQATAFPGETMLATRG